MDSNDLLKARADELERNFYSLRTVEWTVVFQSYAGFAAVAIVYHHLYESYGWWLGAAATTALSFILLTSIYLSIRIQERLHVNRDIMNQYYEELHKKLGVEPFDVGQNGPIHSRRYAFVSHLIVSLAIYVTILGYVLVTTSSACLVALITVIVGVVALGVGCVLGWLRVHAGTVKRNGNAQASTGSDKGIKERTSSENSEAAVE